VQPAVFLDRDNTLIVNDGDLGDPDRVRLLDGVTTGLVALRDAGYRLVVVSNQGGVARGAFTEAAVADVNRRIDQLLRQHAQGRSLIDRFYYCPFHPEGARTEYRREHPWRKPGPGMLLQAAADLDLDLATSWLVGDQERDVVAGQSAGCRTVLLSGQPPPPGAARPTAVARTFAEAVGLILRATPPPPTRGSTVTWSGPAQPPEAPGAGRSIGPSDSAHDISRTARPAREPPRDDGGLESLRRAVVHLTDELRSQRQRRAEFGPMRAAAGLCQMVAILLALLGLLSLDEWMTFSRWMLGALLGQLLTIALLLADLRA
jgi:D-glycero-D-manno-heptose 1,7-bisphosphate phosphatase